MQKYWWNMAVGMDVTQPYCPTVQTGFYEIQSEHIAKTVEVGDATEEGKWQPFYSFVWTY